MKRLFALAAAFLMAFTSFMPAIPAQALGQEYDILTVNREHDNGKLTLKPGEVIEFTLDKSAVNAWRESVWPGNIGSAAILNCYLKTFSGSMEVLNCKANNQEGKTTVKALNKQKQFTEYSNTFTVHVSQERSKDRYEILSTTAKVENGNQIILVPGDRIEFTLQKNAVDGWSMTSWTFSKNITAPFSCSDARVKDDVETVICNAKRKGKTTIEAINSLKTNQVSNQFEILVLGADENEELECAHPPKFAKEGTCIDRYRFGRWERNYRFECLEGYTKLGDLCVSKKSTGAQERVECLRPPRYAVEGTCIDLMRYGRRRRNHEFECEEGYKKRGRRCVRDRGSNIAEECYLTGRIFDHQWYVIELLRKSTDSFSTRCKAQEWEHEYKPISNDADASYEDDLTVYPDRVFFKRRQGGVLRITATRSNGSQRSEPFQVIVDAATSASNSEIAGTFDETCQLSGGEYEKEWYRIAITDIRSGGQSEYCNNVTWQHRHSTSDGLRLKDPEFFTEPGAFIIRRTIGASRLLRISAKHKNGGQSRQYEYLLPGRSVSR